VSNVTVACQATYGYSYSQSITVNAGQVSGGPLTHFPLLFSTTDANLATVANGGYVTNANGYDIIFMGEDSTTCNGPSSCILNFEVESYNATTGQLIAWVNVPSISNSTVIYVFYGNSSITTSQAQPTSVWDSNYAIVSHFANGTTLSVADSTSNGNNGTNTGLTAGTGQIDGGAVSASTSNYISYGNVATGFSTLTTEFWVYMTASTGGMFSKNVNSNRVRILTAGTIQFSHAWSGGSAAWTVTAPSENAWHHIVQTYNGSSASNNPIVYVDGQSVAVTVQSAPSGTLSSDSGTLYFAAYGPGAGSMTGTYDEFRYSSIVRSAGWIATEYNNESAPSLFYTLGSTVTL
jgi:hypothetical protein